ncbi:MAG TPA: type VI secretion system protein [Rhodocyclaceae bacterium]
MTPFVLAGALALVALGLVVWMIVRARKADLPPLQAAQGLLSRVRLPSLARPENSWRGVVGKAVEALSYLSTLREWRYSVPWVMLLGEQGAGKTSLARSITTGRRQELLLREHRLAMEGTSWRFFNRGVVIDPEGALPAAAADTSDGKSWRNVLSALEDYRPERPLDALVLTVSARTLLAADAKAREALAEQCYEQLALVQRKFEFAYPVYLVLTQCDAVEGFDAFWKALPEARTREMWGWSNPSFQDGGTPEQCARAAWRSMGRALRQLQVEAAAQGGTGEDGDRFFLFPRRFGQLEAPLARFLGTVFRPSIYQADNYLRGIYCTGSVEAAGNRRDEARQDVDFVDALFERKIFAETFLARPTRQSIWSRNRLLRHLQQVTIGVFAVLCLTLAASVIHLGNQVDALSGALETLRQPDVADQECVDKDTVYRLLRQIEGVDTRLAYGTIPVSWIYSGAMETSTRVISEKAFKKVIMPGLACRLEQKARDLLAAAPPAASAERPSAEAVAQSRDDLQNYVAEVARFEAAERSFEDLATPSSIDEAEREVRKLWDLAEYAYGEAPPERKIGDDGTFAQVLAKLDYEPRRPKLPPGLEDGLTQRIGTRAAALAAEMKRQVALGDEIIGQMAHGDNVLGATRRFAWWLDWVRKEWLISNDAVNPCRKIADAIDADVRRLKADYGFPAALDEAVARFSRAACYEPAMSKLAAAHMPPYGNLFEKKAGYLQISPAVTAELRGFAALMGEDFMQVTATRPFACLPGRVGWQPQAIEEANRYIRDYQRFARLQGAEQAETATGRRPLYDHLARIQLEAVLDDIMSQGQIPSPVADVLHQAGIEPLSAADQELARRSGDFARIVDKLLHTLRLYRQMGMDASAAQIGQCARDYSSDMLAKVDALATASRLYDPPVAEAKDGGATPVYAVGDAAATKDYLARQLQREQVLGGYAAPYVAFLVNSEAVDESKRSAKDSAAYWDNTLSEIRRYLQFKEPNGQVAFLENYILKDLVGLTYANCRKTLAAYRSESAGHDFFSLQRKRLEDQARWRCDNRVEADAYATYMDLASRFNSELAGRYPFAGLDARDAQPEAVRAFFADYETKRAGLAASVADLDGKRWQEIRPFLGRLDGAANFFRAALADGVQSLRLDLGFRALPKQSPGSEQIVYWRLVSGTRAAIHPNGGTTLEWPVGEVLDLDLQWAAQSKYRPVADPAQGDLVVEGQTASFVAMGQWALLRMLDAHRPRAVPAGAGTDGGRKAIAEFVVPVSAQKAGPAPGRLETSRAYLSLGVSAVDPKTQAATAVPVPPAFPQRAPTP